MTYLGVVNKNPLNIRYSERNRWIGQIGSNKGFCVFSSMDYGLRAACLLVRKYIRRGDNTIAKIIRKWAPPSENDTSAYIRYVVAMMDRLSSCPTKRDDVIFSMEQFYILIFAMAHYESLVSLSLNDIRLVCEKFSIRI